MELEDLDHLDDAPPVWFEPCAGFTADALGGSEICEHCGWLDRDHLVFQRPGAATLSVFDLTSRSSTDLPGAEYLGFFPGWLS